MEPQISPTDGHRSVRQRLSQRVGTAVANRVNGRLKPEDLAEIRSSLKEIAAERESMADALEDLAEAQDVAARFLAEMEKTVEAA